MGFGEFGASSADIPLRYLSVQSSSSAPHELGVSSPRKSVTGIRAVPGFLGVDGLREGDQGDTHIPETLSEAIVCGPRRTLTPPTTPAANSTRPPAALSLPFSASRLESPNVPKGSPRAAAPAMFKNNPYKDGGGTQPKGKPLHHSFVAPWRSSSAIPSGNNSDRGRDRDRDRGREAERARPTRQGGEARGDPGGGGGSRGGVGGGERERKVIQRTRTLEKQFLPNHYMPRTGRCACLYTSIYIALI